MRLTAAAQLAGARNLLRVVRSQTDAIGVAFSGGKDSFATLDLCCQEFRRVEAFYLFRGRGLRVIEELCAFVRRRWGVNVRHYPHFDLSRCYRYAVLRAHSAAAAAAPRIGMADVEACFRRDAAVHWLAYGWRRSDSFSRALILKATGGLDEKAGRVFPLATWRREDVLRYLARRLIPRPPTFGREEQGGVDFHPDTLAYLERAYPDDYARLMLDFAFCGVTRLRPRAPGGRPGRRKSAENPMA